MKSLLLFQWPKCFILVLLGITSFNAVTAKSTDYKNSNYITSNYKKIPYELSVDLEETAKKLKADLEAKGLQVLQGDFQQFKIEDCQYAIKNLGSCLGNNPTAPYLMPTLPLWPDEYVDTTMKDLLGPTRGDTWWTYRLDQREAIVIVGTLPPPGAYFGMQSYLFTRKGTMNTADDIYLSLTEDFMREILFMKAPDPSRLLVFSSLGESNNSVVITKQSGAVWDQKRSFIITADALMEQEVSNSLLKVAALERKDIFVEPVSSKMARLGLGAEADDFLTLIRYTLPENEAAGVKWRENPPLVVFRVREAHTDRAAKTYPLAVREQRVANSELYLKDHVQNLVQAVKAKWRQNEAFSGSFQSLLTYVDLVGDHCLKRPMNCIGDSGDADYQISPTVSIDSDEVIAVVGTLATATRNAVYVSLSLNRIPVLQAIGNLTQKDLVGTASAFAESIDHTDKLYLQYFARDCKNLSPCFEVTEDMVPRGESLKVVQRNYIVPGTNRGPDPQLMVSPSIIVFDRNLAPTNY